VRHVISVTADQDVLDRKHRGWNVPTGDLDNESFKESERICSLLPDLARSHC
jgi:hypothetical protein